MMQCWRGRSCEGSGNPISLVGYNMSCDSHISLGVRSGTHNKSTSLHQSIAGDTVGWDLTSHSPALAICCQPAYLCSHQERGSVLREGKPACLACNSRVLPGIGSQWRPCPQTQSFVSQGTLPASSYQCKVSAIQTSLHGC
jgi:hypothetical protein